MRLLALYGGSYHAALKAAEAQRLSPMVIGTLKAAAPAMTTSAGDALMGPYVWPAFQGSMRTISAFDAIGAEAVQTPFFQKVGMFTTAFTGGKVAEGAAKLFQRPLALQQTLTPEKFVAGAALTKEFLDGAPNAFQSFATQLQAAVATAVDTEFLADIAATETDPSSGLGSTSLADITADIVGQLLPMVDYSQRSSLWLVVGLDHARAMTTAAFAAGINSMTPFGGTFLGLRVLVSDALPSATIVLIDATGLAVAYSPITIKASDETTVALATTSSQTSASGTGENMESMLQTNSVAIVSERSIAFCAVRPNAYASLTSIGWGTSTDSPLP